ncbi:MAG: methyltransferase [Oscillospiraceae bacterium]|nr:methyltransferase [Oscillospiraceae bacterium]
MSELWKNGPSFEDGSFKVSTDSVLLASFASPKGKNGIDIGCGSGIISLIMLCTNETLHMTGIDVNEDAAETASSNIQRNGLSARYKVICGDIREHRKLFNTGSFDFAVCNPPYYPENSGKLSSNTVKALARGETLCTLEDICKAAAYLLPTGGSFYLVHKPERLSEIFCTMTKYSIEPKRLREVQYRIGRAPSLVLIEGRRGGRKGLIIESPLILTNDDGTETKEVLEIYRRA